jgi:hypothetical protein
MSVDPIKLFTWPHQDDLAKLARGDLDVLQPEYRPIWRVWVDALLDLVRDDVAPQSKLPAGLRSNGLFAWITETAPVKMPEERRVLAVRVDPALSFAAPFEPIDRMLSNAGIERVRATIRDSDYRMDDAREELPFLDYPQTRISVAFGPKVVAQTTPELLKLVIRALKPDMTEYLTSARTLPSWLRTPASGTWEVLVPREAVQDIEPN